MERKKFVITDSDPKIAPRATLIAIIMAIPEQWKHVNGYLKASPEMVERGGISETTMYSFSSKISMMVKKYLDKGHAEYMACMTGVKKPMALQFGDHLSDNEILPMDEAKTWICDYIGQGYTGDLTFRYQSYDHRGYEFECGIGISEKGNNHFVIVKKDIKPGSDQTEGKTIDPILECCRSLGLTEIKI